MEIRRRRFKQTVPLGDRLIEEARKLREKAQITPGVRWERLIRRARQLDTAAQFSDWISSPRLAPPS